MREDKARVIVERPRIRCVKRYIAREVFGIIARQHRLIREAQIAA